MTQCGSNVGAWPDAALVTAGARLAEGVIRRSCPTLGAHAERWPVGDPFSSSPRHFLVAPGGSSTSPCKATTSWRRGRDSNPRYGCPYAAFRVRCIQPLCHLSNYLILIFFLLSHLAARWPFAPFCSQFSLEARLFTATRSDSSTRTTAPSCIPDREDSQDCAT
jgi:hypothetical protein